MILNLGRLVRTWPKKQMSGGAELDALEHELRRVA